VFGPTEIKRNELSYWPLDFS